MPKIVDHEKRRLEIIAALWRVVARDGFHAVTVRSVAAEAGLNPTTVALAFQSRTELLALAYSELSGREDQRLANLAKRGMSVEVLVDACLLALPLTKDRAQHASVWVALVEAADYDPIASKALAEFANRVNERVREMLDRAVASGVLREDVNIEQQVLLLHAILDGLAIQITGTKQPKTPAIRAALADHFRSLLPRP